MPRSLIVIGLICLIVYGTVVLTRYLEKRAEDRAKIDKENRTVTAISIARRRALCDSVDQYIVDQEHKGESAPLELVNARIQVNDAPNDEVRAYAAAALEKEWIAINSTRRKQLG
jgi:hypothetical protein